jgi:hypothetical protein
MALQILNGLDPRKIPRWADKIDAEMNYDKAIEKRELDWPKKSKLE